jgi:hypothetical protein
MESDHFILLRKKECITYQNLLSSSRTGSYFSIPCPRQAGMKSKQKSCQNEPSAGRFDGPHTRSDENLVIFEKW